MPRRPNFFIVGAPKCGTTALSEYLRAHPRIFMSWPKEPHYFASDFPRYRRVSAADEYERLFEAADGHLAVGEASVWYLYSTQAARNIRQFNPEARIIVMLRNPADMLYSLHSQMVYSYYEDVKDFQEAWKLQESRREGDNLPRGCIEPAQLQYLSIGRFAEQMERLYSVFPRSQVLVFLMEDLVASTPDVYHQALDFLHVPDDGRTVFPRVNESKAQRSQLVGRWMYRPPYPLKLGGDLLKRALQWTGMREIRLWHRLLALNARARRQPPLAADFRATLMAAFRDDVRRLAEIVERDLDHWLAEPAARPE